jgi:phosphoribosylamine--glycine ligase
MKVLVIGKGGREHALLWRLNQSETARKLYCAGGNPGISQLAQVIPVAQNDFAGLVDFVRSEKIDLTVVGAEGPLAGGIVDEFDRAGLRIFGPTKAAAQLEASKAFAKAVMREAGVPTASFEVFDEAEAARRWVRARGGPMVVKADGLALGKGVVVCEDAAAALTAIDDAMERRRFGAAGARIVIEERLKGEELSFFALCDGEDAIALGLVQDHKAAFDGDRGPNTGGMGSYSPVSPIDAARAAELAQAVHQPVLDELARRGIPFHGVLYAGLMMTAEGPQVLEFNVRFGDPETQAILPRLRTDLLDLAEAATEPGGLSNIALEWAPETAVTVVLASPGYPEQPRTGDPITGLELVPDDVFVTHAGTTRGEDGSFLTAGGRVLSVTALGADVAAAREAAYAAADMIDFPGKQLRRDIAMRLV